MINLSRFHRKDMIVTPVISGRSQYHRRKLFFSSDHPDNWYEIRLGDDPEIISPAEEIEIKKILKILPSIQGYSFGDEIVPLHFDSMNFKYGLSESISIYFMKVPLWSISRVRRWEDGKWFFDSLDAKADIEPLLKVKRRFEKEQDLRDLKGIMPELRYYFIIMQLQKSSLRQAIDLEKLKLTRQEREKRLKDFQNTLAGRLEKTITDAGGHLQVFKKQGKNLIVDWSVGGQKFNSLIKADTFRIWQLGYCASGEDKFHSMTSAVLLAREYQKDDSIHITRE